MKETLTQRAHRWLYWPYAVRKEAGGIVFLNRNYKPLGIDTREHIDYAPYVIPVPDCQATWNILWKALSDPEDDSIQSADECDTLFFYNDGNIPHSVGSLRTYVEKLVKVMQTGMAPDLFLALDREWENQTHA